MQTTEERVNNKDGNDFNEHLMAMIMMINEKKRKKHNNGARR